MRDPLLNRRCVRLFLGTFERACLRMACYVQGQSFAVVSLGCSPSVWSVYAQASDATKVSFCFFVLLKWPSKIIPSQLLF